MMYYNRLVYVFLLLLFGSFFQTEDLFGINVDIKGAGAKGDGVLDDTGVFRNAVEKIGAGVGVIEISDGIFVVNKISFPENVILKFCGGKISVPKNGSVEINGSIDAAFCEIFTGEGQIKGSVKNLYIYPQWFGAKGDERNDDSIAIQKAASFAQFSSGKTLFIPGGRYLIENNIEFACSVESRGVIVKTIEIDEASKRTTAMNPLFSFTPVHFIKKNPMIFFKPDCGRITLAPDAFYGIKRNDFKVKNFENIPLADKPQTKINLVEGGTLTFYSSDFFTSRENQLGDERYDKNDQCQIVSSRGDVFPEFCFSYDAFPDAPEWNLEKVYKKGDYCKYNGKIFKATFPSGPGTVFESRFKGKVDIGPVSPEKGGKYEFKYHDGNQDKLNIWLELITTVSYLPPQIPLTVNNLSIEIYLKGSDGKTKRIDASSTLSISRSNMTFNNMSISCKSRNACLSSLCGISRCSRIVFNNCNFSGATYHGLGYNVVNSNVSNITFNNCISVNCRDAIAGRHGKNITINGGYFFSIDDHYGKNYTVRDAVIQGISTNIPGYCTPRADLEKWDFVPRTAFAFGGGDIHIENCRIYNTNSILALRGGEADMEDSRITIKEIVVKNNRNIAVISHGINKSFDFAHELQMPRVITLENIKINEPYSLVFVANTPSNLRYGDIYARNCGTWRDFKVNANTLSFSDCTFKDSKFDVGAATLCNFSNCVFSGKVTGLSSENIGRASGNCKTKGSELSFPLKYINGGIYEE